MATHATSINLSVMATDAMSVQIIARALLKNVIMKDDMYVMGKFIHVGISFFKKMISIKKEFPIAVLWFICGNLTWKSAAYVFGNFSSLLVFPNNVLHIHYRPAFVVYTITDLIIIFLI